MKNSTKTIIISAALVSAMAIGGTLAYFTDKDSAINKIDVGQVTVDLTEPNWDSKPDTDKNGVPDHAENVVPTQVISKDPKITNTGANDAYVYLKVSVPKANIFTANSDGTKNPQAVTQLFSYTINTGWTLLKTDTTDTKVNTYVYGYNTKLSPTAATSTLFDNITFCNAIEGQGLENTVQNIDVNAMAIQTENTGTMAQAFDKYINQNK